MNEPKGREKTGMFVRHKGLRKALLIGLSATLLAVVFLLSGCTVKDVLDPVNGYFNREASAQEETADETAESALQYAQVNDADGRAMVRSDGEPLTVLVAYETATGGEPKINASGELETHPVGEVMTYAAGSAVLSSEGEAETYAGGEIVRDLLGFAQKDENGETITRAAGEMVTHGADDVVLDGEGERVLYNGEPLTLAAGDLMYDENGELETYAVAVLKDDDGEPVTRENGQTALSAIEMVTDSAGNPMIEENGEAATKLLDPLPPRQLVDMPFPAGTYYINNITSPYVFFAAPTVQAANVAIVTDEGVDAGQYAGENGEGMINNLQLEILGDELPYFEVRYDAQGYAFFVMEGTEQALTLAGDLRNGVNVLLKDIEKTPYPQYKYWDDPMYTVADSQKWLIKPLDDGSYSICSYLDENYVMTVDDQFGTQYANIMIWTYDGRELQRFHFTPQKPVIERYIEEGTYYISSGLSDWMMISLGDYNYNDGSSIYLNSSDQGDGQQFHITYDKYGFATITHGDSNEVLTVSYAEARNGQSICQYPADGDDWQRWIIDPAKNGGYYIRSALNISEVMDLKDGEARTEKEILMHWNNDTLAQSWYFHEESIPAAYMYSYMDDYAQNFSSQTDYLILVSSESNHVGVYYGSQYNWTCVQFWDCVTGKSSTPTVKGEYEIYVKTPSFDGNMDSPVWYTVYYASGWYPQYFFHSIIYYQGTKDIMDASMGYNASHGCVRLYTDNAQWIYDNVPLHTKVVSY